MSKKQEVTDAVVSAALEAHMKALYESLSERNRRRYAAIEAEKLGHGGVRYIAGLFGCEEDTIRRGREDVELLPHDEGAARVRKKREAARNPASPAPDRLRPSKRS